MHILGLSGSLRKNSFNTAALNACQALLPPGVSLSCFDIASVPLYNEDVREQGFPPSVQALREQIAAADALLICSPEYNYSIPGVLKNAIDWASRPPAQPFDGKPIALMGASPGALGTARAQYHLRQVCVYLNLHPLNRPEVFGNAFTNSFDADGNVVDAKIQENITTQLAALVSWTQQLQK